MGHSSSTDTRHIRISRDVILCLPSRTSTGTDMVRRRNAFTGPRLRRMRFRARIRGSRRRCVRRLRRARAVPCVTAIGIDTTRARGGRSDTDMDTHREDNVFLFLFRRRFFVFAVLLFSPCSRLVTRSTRLTTTHLSTSGIISITSHMTVFVSIVYSNVYYSKYTVRVGYGIVCISYTSIEPY